MSRTNFDFETEYDVEYKGREIPCTLQIQGSFVTDDNYGADADGNRGVSMSFVEDFYVTIINDKKQDITESIEKADPKQYKYLCDYAMDEANEKVESDRW